MPITAPPRPSRTGYTLIEVLIVVTILGIISAIVVPQMLSAGTLGVQAAARTIVADLIYAQNEAIAKQAKRSVVFDPATNSYKLLDQHGEILTASWRNGQSEEHMVNFNADQRFAGVSITDVDFNGDATITFNALGGPDSGGTIDIAFNEHRYQIKVTPFTGRITVEGPD